MKDIIILIVRIIFLILGVSLSKNKLLFLIAGYDSEKMNQNQSRILGKIVGQFIILCSILLISDFIRKNFWNNADSSYFYIVMIISFIIGLAIMTYSVYQLLYKKG